MYGYCTAMHVNTLCYASPVVLGNEYVISAYLLPNTTTKE